MRISPPLHACAVLLAACGSAAAPDVPEPRPIEVPAAAGAALPFAAAGPDGIVLSWTEPTPAGHALRFAQWTGAGWSAVGTVAEGADWFVNWADFPSVVPLGNVLAAHWLQRSGPGRYSYDVLATLSRDGGATWSPPLRPHADGTETEHGFVTIFAHDGAPAAVWLDGRAFAGAGHDGHGDHAGGEMQVRFARLPDGDAPAAETVLDERACDCCQTAVAVTADGPVVFYRDRSAEEIRDISVTRLVGGRWTPPAAVHRDGWQIAGCPVNGPAADADGRDVVVAWFTAADEDPRVNVAFSSNAGASFGAPVRIDGGAALGRVDVILLEGGRAFVVWLENDGEGAALRGRVVDRRGAGAPRTLAATSAQRASGFPRMARRNGEVLLAWTEPGDPSRVRAAVLDF